MLLLKSVDLIKSPLNKNQSVVTTDKNLVLGEFKIIYIIEDAIFNFIDFENNDRAEFVESPARLYLIGKIKGYQLASGKVVAYLSC